MKAWSSIVQGKVKGCESKVKKRIGQSQSKVKVRSRQYNHNLNCNYNLMGFDTIEINLVSERDH